MGMWWEYDGSISQLTNNNLILWCVGFNEMYPFLMADVIYGTF